MEESIPCLYSVSNDVTVFYFLKCFFLVNYGYKNLSVLRLSIDKLFYFI